jgi:hypothetical protein
MVQISNTLIIAAAVVPALAAPVLDVRGLSGLRKAGKIFGKVADGASLASNVATIVQQRELDLEAREPITGAQAKAFAKGAGEVAHHAKSGIEFGAAVAPLFPHKQRREFDVELEAREPRITGAQAKAFAKGAGEIAHHAQSGIEFGAAVAPLFPQKQRRSLEDLEARGKFHVSSSNLKMGGGAVAAAAGFAGTVALMNTQQHRRDFDELDARDPKFNFGKVLGKVAGVASNFIRDDETGDIYVREYDDAELDARDPKFNFGKVLGKVAGVASNFIRDDESGEMYVREYDDAEFDAREPKFPFGLIKGVAKLVLRETSEIDELD